MKLEGASGEVKAVKQLALELCVSSVNPAVIRWKPPSTGLANSGNPGRPPCSCLVQKS